MQTIICYNFFNTGGRYKTSSFNLYKGFIQLIIKDKLSPLISIPNDELDNLIKMFPNGVVTLDLETTGLSPLIDKIVEISAIKVCSNKKIEIFDTLINPQIPIPEHIIKIHGITNEMVKDAKTIEDQLLLLKEFISTYPIIAHNAKFDIGFLIFNMHKLSISPNNNNIHCSCALSRATFSNSKNYKLNTLAEYLEIPLLSHHRAMDDTIACLRIFAQAIMQNVNNKKTEINNSKSFLFNMNDFSQNSGFKIPLHLEKLKKLVKNQTPLEILYLGGSHKGVFRPITPISLLPMPSGIILYALCHLSDNYRSFFIKRIKDIRILKKK